VSKALYGNPSQSVEHHLPYGITHLAPDTGELALP